MFASYGADGKLTRAAGGSYTLRGEEYVEKPEYGIGRSFDAIRGETQAFTWKVEGDKWYHTGELSSGQFIEEVWQRVEGERAA